MSEDLTDIATRMRIVRESTGKTQKEFAKLIGVSPPAIQSYELGKSLPGGKILEKLAKKGFNTNWILTGNGKMITADYFPNLRILEASARTVDEYTSATNTPISPEEREQLIAKLYRNAKEIDLEPTKRSFLDIFLNLVKQTSGAHENGE